MGVRLRGRTPEAALVAVSEALLRCKRRARGGEVHGRTTAVICFGSVDVCLILHAFNTVPLTVLFARLGYFVLQDMIPRMSLWTIERLRDEMMICALRCKVSSRMCTVLSSSIATRA